MFRFEDLAFRPMDEADLELVRRMHNEDTTLLQLGDPMPVSSTQQKAWWENMSRSRTNTHFCVCHESYENVIGVWRLLNLDVTNRNCEVGADVFPQYRRRGFGLKLCRMILCYLFDHMNIHMAYTLAGAFNEGGLGLYRKAGFQETGRLTGSLFRFGRYWDSIFLCITVDQYRKAGGSGGLGSERTDRRE